MNFNIKVSVFFILEPAWLILVCSITLLDHHLGHLPVGPFPKHVTTVPIDLRIHCLSHPNTSPLRVSMSVCLTARPPLHLFVCLCTTVTLYSGSNFVLQKVAHV